MTYTGNPRSSERFQTKLKASNNIGEALVEIFSDLVQLEIVTWVAHDGDTAHKVGNRLRTTINLIDGDIENELGEEFLDGAKYSGLRGFHESQVAKGSETIANNLKTLIDVGQQVTVMLKGETKDQKAIAESPSAAANDWNPPQPIRRQA